MVVIAVAAVFMLLVFVYPSTAPATLPRLKRSLPSATSLNALIARPRTKEMIIGWPMLMLFIWSLRRGMKFLPMVFGMGMSIGLVSVVNTFLHSHAVSAQPAAHRFGRALRFFSSALRPL